MNLLYNPLKLIILVFSLSLSSCALIPKDFSKNPLSVEHDEMKGVTWIKSNWLNHYCGTTQGYLAPYLGERKNSIWAVLKVQSNSSKTAIHYRNITLKCGNQAPLVIKQKPFENWSKSFDNNCSQYGCTTYEKAEISIPKDKVSYIFSCQDKLTVRLSGNAKYVEFTYDTEKDQNFFKGLAGLRMHIASKIKSGAKLL